MKNLSVGILGFITLVILSLLLGSSDRTLPAAAHLLAVALELADHRESPITLAALRDRVMVLTNAPPLSDHLRFAPRHVAAAYCALNREWVQTIAIHGTWSLIDHSAYADARWEADRLYEIWDAIRDAGGEHNGVVTRRAALARLRELLGRDAYAAAAVPPPIPLHRVQR